MGHLVHGRTYATERYSDFAERTSYGEVRADVYDSDSLLSVLAGSNGEEMELSIMLRTPSDGTGTERVFNGTVTELATALRFAREAKRLLGLGMEGE